MALQMQIRYTSPCSELVRDVKLFSFQTVFRVEQALDFKIKYAFWAQNSYKDVTSMDTTAFNFKQTYNSSASQLDFLQQISEKYTRSYICSLSDFQPCSFPYRSPFKIGLPVRLSAYAELLYGLLLHFMLESLENLRSHFQFPLKFWILRALDP